MKNRFTVLVGALLATALVTGQANAQVISGTTRGCFGTGCTPGTSLATFGGLTFNGGTFNTTNGFVGGLTNNFGSFTLSANGNYTGTFRLFFDFLTPGTSVGNPIFGAAVEGVVTTTTDGVGITWFTPTQTAVLSNGIEATVTVNNVSVNQLDLTQPISGRVTATPEPASLVLMATGLVGVYGAARRRRKQTA